MAGRYRWRTSMRRHLPWIVMPLFPKGRKDCGNHEWALSDEDTYLCYHCSVGIRPPTPEERGSNRLAAQRRAIERARAAGNESGAPEPPAQA